MLRKNLFYSLATVGLFLFTSGANANNAVSPAAVGGEPEAISIEQAAALPYIGYCDQIPTPADCLVGGIYYDIWRGGGAYGGNRGQGSHYGDGQHGGGQRGGGQHGGGHHSGGQHGGSHNRK